MITTGVLFFEGCPNREPTVQLASSKLAKVLGLTSEIREAPVSGFEEAEALRFLGFPSVCANCGDIESAADDRTDFSLSCRIHGAIG